MEDIFKDVEPQVLESRINVPYSWWAGDTASRFFTSLRDEKKLSGTRCDQCGKVFVPPRKTCPRCFIEEMRWVELSGRGTLESYTVARRQLAALKKPVPVIFGLIRLDGADTAILHHIGEIDPDAVEIGLRVQAHFAAKRSGTIEDIEYFKPASVK
jgi:uncharacterized OB-fold protein